MLRLVTLALAPRIVYYEFASWFKFSARNFEGLRSFVQYTVLRRLLLFFRPAILVMAASASAHLLLILDPTRLPYSCIPNGFSVSKEMGRSIHLRLLAIPSFDNELDYSLKRPQAFDSSSRIIDYFNVLCLPWPSIAMQVSQGGFFIKSCTSGLEWE